MGPADASVGFYQRILKYVGLLATVAVVVVVTRIARKALREAEQQQERSGMTADMPRLDAEHKPTTVDQMMLVDDVHDRQLIENCHPPRWVNPTPSGKYNLVVVGAGTAGLVSAAGAAGLGAKVALIERNLLGGDCLNVGCVPSRERLVARAAFGSPERNRVRRP